VTQATRGRRTRKTDSTESAITQAQYMIRIYAEILATHDAVLDRVRQLVVRPHEGDREAELATMRLTLAQLEKVGERIAYWNARVRTLLAEQVAL
jgi:hypothetical protein